MTFVSKSARRNGVREGMVGREGGRNKRKKRRRLVKLKNLNRRRQRRGSMTDIGGGQPDGMY